MENERMDNKNELPEQNAFRDTPGLRECLGGLSQNEDGCYTVSSLAQLGTVLRKLQEEKARQIDEEKHSK